jgi:hypothetical protein
MKPYLKGVHLTANSWRPNRNKDGWPTGEQVVIEEREEEEFKEHVMREGAAGWVDDYELDEKTVEENQVEFVKAVPRLKQDLMALARFMNHDSPVMVVLRPVRVVYNLAYGFSTPLVKVLVGHFELRSPQLETSYGLQG